MAKFTIPTDISLHTAHNFFETNKSLFDLNGGKAILEFNSGWMHLEPMALSMIAAWGAWCKQNGLAITLENLGKRADYAARMKLFEMLQIPYEGKITEHEEAGRFMPLRNVKTGADVRSVIADVSALLHLNEDVESLAAVQYCLSELMRNVLEHSMSEDGAFVCAHNYSEREPHRITLAVADCGIGIREHLSYRYPAVKNDDLKALEFAMQPGISGARPGVYGTPDNAGAGLFITRGIAKGTGGYFFIASGYSGYRLRRALNYQAQRELFPNPFFDRSDQWRFETPWQGTIVSLEIRTENIQYFDGFFSWIREQIPPRETVGQRIRFT
jgi:hypothetical protein